MRALSSRLFRALPAVALLCAVLPASANPLPSAAVGPVAAPTDTPEASESEAPTREMEWYTAEVPVSSQESRERHAALGRALAQVLVRVSGRAAAPTDPVVQKALRVAESMLVGTDYRDVEEMVGGVPLQRQVLAASFDPDAVDALVVAAGLPLWLGERPKPMLWLAIDDGGGAGARLVSAQQINVVKPLAQRGLERGVRFLLPGGTAVEQPAASSIWALDPAAIAVLSGRYGARMQLLGKVSRAGTTGWTSEWLLANGGEELARWSVTDPSPQRAIAAGADRAADVLAARQAKRIEAGKAEVIEAEILGISSQSGWLNLAAYLQSLPVLRGFEVVEAKPDALRVRLDLAVDRARFEAMLAGSGRLVPETTAMTSDPTLPTLIRYRLAR
ncbi:MAG: DUF2066 domain-containing protein [Silanimonas sp.]